MGNNSSSGYGHSFLDFFHSIGDFGSSIGGLFQGDVSGWSKWANDMKTYGNDVAQTFTNNKYTRYNDPSGPGPDPFGTDTSRSQSASGGTAGTNAPTASTPPSAVSSNTRSAVNATYSSLGGTVPPSNLQAISDPNAKMAIASSRGSQRQSLNIANASSDITSANSIATASQAPQQ